MCTLQVLDFTLSTSTTLLRKSLELTSTTNLKSSMFKIPRISDSSTFTPEGHRIYYLIFLRIKSKSKDLPCCLWRCISILEVIGTVYGRFGRCLEFSWKIFCFEDYRWQDCWDRCFYAFHHFHELYFYVLGFFLLFSVLELLRGPLFSL